MKIAIHHRPGSFSDDWIAYCKQENIFYKIVNCYDNDIIQQVKGCDAFMWHHHHTYYKDVLFAKKLLFSLQQVGKKVFPDFNTGWHFDDKVGQKYLLESINAPLVPSYVFYIKREALDWANSATFPKVFKLRGGAGSKNVKLVQNKSQAIKLINKAFGRGFSQFDRRENLNERIRKAKIGQDNYWGILKGIARLLIPTEYAKMRGKEKGYGYFQDFVPENDFDIRVIVVDKKAFAIKRMVRKNDFRASGSGDILYDKKHFNISTIKLALETAQELKTQCCAFDFIYNSNNIPLIVEISYGFTKRVYEPCVGYWDEKLNFHEGEFNPYGWMVEMMLR